MERAQQNVGNMKNKGFGESSQGVRVLVILAEDLGLVNPSTQMAVHNHS